MVKTLCDIHFSSWTAWEKALKTRGLTRNIAKSTRLDRRALQASSPKRVGVTVGEWIGFRHMAAKLGPEGQNVFFCPLELVPIPFNSRLICVLWPTWPPRGKKIDWIEQAIVCTRQNLKPGYFDRRHLGETTLATTALDLQSEDYESNTNKPIIEIRAIHVLSILSQTEVSPQSSLTKMVAVNFLASKMKQKLDPVFFSDQCTKVNNKPSYHPEYPIRPHSLHTSTSNASLEIISLSRRSMLKNNQNTMRRLKQRSTTTIG